MNFEERKREKRGVHPIVPRGAREEGNGVCSDMNYTYYYRHNNKSLNLVIGIGFDRIMIFFCNRDNTCRYFLRKKFV